MKNEVVRFVLGGLGTTLLTYTLYLAMLLVSPYRVAYTVSYASGILIAFVVNSLVVFRVPLRWRRLVPYPLVYLLQYLLGLALLVVGVEWLGVTERIMPVFILVVTLPASFLMNRLLLGAGPAGKSRGGGRASSA